MKRFTALLITLCLALSMFAPLSVLAEDQVTEPDKTVNSTVQNVDENTDKTTDETTEGTEETPVKAFKVTEKISVAQTKTAAIKATYENLEKTGTLTFSSSSTKIATVTAAGVVKGIAPGTATVTATYLIDGETYTAKTAVTVTKFVPAKKIAFSAKKVSGKIGQKKQLKVIFSPKNTTKRSLTFKTSDKYVCKVSSKGVIKFTGPGKCTVTATTKDGTKKTAKITVVSKGTKKGWFTLGKRKYYINGKGNAVKGYKKIKNNFYYFNKKGVMVTKKWVYVKTHKKKYKLYFKKNGKQAQNVDKLIGKQKKYKVMVNCKTNCITVYAKDGKNGYIIPVKAIICSTGVGNCTIKGTFTIRRVARWHELMGGVWGQYVSQISGNYLFHSAWYYSTSHKALCVSEFNKLGRQASHGCVRLTVADAKWIYKRCAGSKVKTYSSKYNGPLKKPAKPKCVRVSGDRGYDPSDPYFK